MGAYRVALWESGVAGLGMPRKHQRSGYYRAYIPSPLMGQRLEVSAAASAALSEAERLCASLDASLATRQEAGEAPLAMLHLLEGVGSSAMEGYRSAAARLVASMATGGAGAKGSDMKIVGNLAALDRALAFADAGQITVDDLVSMQADLMNERGESSLVGVREEQNWVGGSDYHPLDAGHVPPPPDLVDALMGDLCGFVSSESPTPPLLRAALAHAQFETIHPFLDGNGRTGRALVHLMLRRDGLLDRTVLPLSGTWGHDKPRYIDYLNALRSQGDGWDRDTLDVAAHFMADTTTDAATGAFAIAAAVQGVEEGMGERVRENFRADSVAHRIVHDVCVNLGVTVDTVAACHGVDSVAVLRTLDRMEGLNIVKRRSAQRPHVFYAPDMVRLVERFAAQIPEGVGDEKPAPDTDALLTVAAAQSLRTAREAKKRCGVWMPRARAACALSKGHPGWPISGHRQSDG